MPIFKAAKMFDPYSFAVIQPAFIEFLKDLSELEACRTEYPIYLAICLDYTGKVEMADGNLLKFWILFKGRIPNLFSLASWVLAFPTNTAEVERSISRYNNILTKDRNRLKEENIKALNFVQFNNRAFLRPPKNILNSSEENLEEIIIEDEIIIDDDVEMIESDQDYLEFMEEMTNGSNNYE